MRRLSLARALLLLAAAPAAAQSVRGQVVERGTGRAGPGAVVSLHDAGSTRRAARLGRGGALLRPAAGGGRWKLRVERVGHATVGTGAARRNVLAQARARGDDAAAVTSDAQGRVSLSLLPGRSELEVTHPTHGPRRLGVMVADEGPATFTLRLPRREYALEEIPCRPGPDSAPTRGTCASLVPVSFRRLRSFSPGVRPPRGGTALPAAGRARSSRRLPGGERESGRGVPGVRVSAVVPGRGPAAFPTASLAAAGPDERVEVLPRSRPGSGSAPTGAAA